MANFKKGDRVICIAKVPYWSSNISLRSCIGPRYNEILTVDGIELEPKSAIVGLIFYKYSREEGFDCTNFRKLHTDKVSSRELLKEPVEETSDVPVPVE